MEQLNDQSGTQVHLVIMKFHIPGYNYCGPGTDDFSQEPINELDRACKKHDLGYSKLGNLSYIYWNEADEELLENIKDIRTPEAEFVRRVFNYKKYIAPMVWRRGNKYIGQKRNRGFKPVPVKRRKIGVNPIRTVTKRGRYGTFIPKTKYRKNIRRQARKHAHSYFKTPVSYRGLKASRQNHNIQRILNSGAATANANTVTYFSFFVGDQDGMEAMAADIKYYDVTDAGATVVKTMNILTGGLIGSVTMKVLSMKQFIRLRNNSTMPMKLTLYKCTPKFNTEDQVTTALFDGWNDQFGTILSGTTNLDPNLYPKDSPSFMRRYRIQSVKHGVLNSGAEMYTGIRMLPRSYRYDPDIRDNQQNALRFMRNVTQFLLVRIEGTLSHDTTNVATQIGISNCQLDWSYLEERVYTKDSKVQQHFVTTSGGYDAPSVGFEFADPQEGKMEGPEV